MTIFNHPTKKRRIKNRSPDPNPPFKSPNAAVPIVHRRGGEGVVEVCVADRWRVYSDNGSYLIREPLRVLMQRMEQEAFTKVDSQPLVYGNRKKIKNMGRASKKLGCHGQNSNVEFTDLRALQASSEDQTDESVQQAPVVHERFWVDKYAPISFTELLSDEQTNREVLLWLKQWDSHVFGSEIKSTSDDRNNGGPKWSNRSFKNSYSSNNNSNFKKSYSSNTDKSNFKNSYSSNTDKSNFKNSYSSNTDKSFNGNQDLSNRKMRSTGPPEQKILLLCGSPGLGKTTLAHVAAKHCGYHVLEGFIRIWVFGMSQDAIQIQNKTGGNFCTYDVYGIFACSSFHDQVFQYGFSPVYSKSCFKSGFSVCHRNPGGFLHHIVEFVIDEIDGSLGDGKGAVDVILKMVSAEKKHVSEKENDQSAKKSSKKGHKASTLSRPVICICNDLFAPALRRLRQVAKVHVFVQPSVSRVASRLKFICNKEGMRTSSIALTALAEYTECDIRSCLNTLQFLNKKKEALDVMGISSQVVGRKDMSKGVFDIWKEYFVPYFHYVKTATLLTGVFTECRGDYDLIFDGIHENFLQLSYHDRMMHKTVKCLNSIGISDLMHQYIMRTQKMSIYVYQPSLSIIIHNQIAQVERPNLEWPKSNQRYRTMLIEKNEVFKSWHVKIRPCVSRHLSTKSFLEDSVSLLLHILSPTTLRPISISASYDHSQVFFKLVDSAVALHLLSEKEKNELAQLVSMMVSYSITYKNVKSDPSYSDFGHGSAADAHELSFDPPINSFINFKGYGSGHRVLAIPMKQLLLHEMDATKENQNMVGEQTRGNQPFKIDRPATVTGNNSRPSNPSKSLNPSTSQNTSATISVKPNPTADKKKRSNGPTNFFDRLLLCSSYNLKVE
ncbi:hypothetical protein ACFE04_015722 [Oxalis oulophora]